MKQHKMSYLSALIITVVVSLLLLYVVDARLLGERRYLTEESTFAALQKQCDDLQNIFEPYGIDFYDYLFFDDHTPEDADLDYFETNKTSYVAEIPMEENCLLTIYVRRNSNGFPLCTVSLTRDECANWEDSILIPSQYPVLFEVMAYYSGGRLSAHELYQAEMDMYQEAMDQVQSDGKDHVSYYSKEFKGIFVEIGDIGYGYYCNDSGLYQTEMQYYCPAYC